MKRFLIPFGLLLMLLPQLAAAAPVAMSPYVERVLSRAQAGIDHARDGTTTIPSMGRGARVVGAALLRLIDTKQRIIDAGKDLNENTACLHIDFFLLEDKLRAAQEELNKAYNEKNPIAIRRLQDVIAFLNERMELLLLGAREPTVLDTEWQTVRLFDPPKDVFCCGGIPGVDQCRADKRPACLARGDVIFSTEDQCTAYGCKAAGDPPDEKLCPFHTDYLPPTVTTGFGCDEETLMHILGGLEGELQKTVAAEADGLREVTRIAEEQLQTINAFTSLEQKLALLLGRPPETSGPPAARKPHTAVAGCPEAWPPDADKNKDVWPDGSLKWELRSPFTIELDQRKLLNAFQELRLKEAGARPIPGEFDTRARSDRTNAFVRVFDTYGIDWFGTFSKRQGIEESEIFAQASDTHLSVARAVSRLRASVGKLSKLAHDMTGLRGFVRDFAYYLRRSCIARPCNTRLDQVLKIIFQDSCFPYTNGEYLNGTSYETCKREAELLGIP
ncbi:MAG TPA: hypothetical protein VI873_04450 [Candidatus Peribacteraceae bacterium]|nr:hypothetical protein [Candidatus Peribacteraceae bacterium]